jgi:hypothetical protein
MKLMKKKLIQALLWLTLGLVPQIVWAEVPGTMTYQGSLSDNAGNPVDGTIELTFSIPGTTWTEKHTGVSVKKGLFGVLLGSKSSLINVDFSQPRSLRVEYNGTSQTISLSSVGTAITAQKVIEDKDTLAGLNCAKDQIVKHNGTAWECANPATTGGLGGSNGSVFIRWGNGTAPNGTTLLYSGYAFSGYYTQGGGGGEPTCMKGGDVGAPGPGNYYGDLLYPLGTGDATRMPPGISPRTEIKCAVVYAEGPSFEMWGSQSCPTGWTVAYRGYGMGGFYYRYGKSNRQCVENAEYDYSVPNPTWGGIWYGTVLYNNKDVGIYETNRYVKCARCVKN